MAKKRDGEKEKLLLQHLQREQALRDALKFSQKRFKKFNEVIIQLYNGERLDKFFSTDKRIWKIYSCFNRIQKGLKILLKDVLIYLDNNSGLIDNEKNIQAVYNMVSHRVYWRNDIYKWKPCSKSADAQMKELVNYLFCQYSIPAFMYKAFFEEKDTIQINWSIHLASGRKVKEMRDVPIPFTQKTGHYFLHAPANYSIAEALRWAQVKALGGDDKLAARVVASWLGNKPYSNEDFWERFIQIVIQGGMFNLNKLTELIDYVREAKRENAGYHLKGRTLQSLLRQSDEWHSRFVHKSRAATIWKPCGIEGVRIERKSCIIKLEELTEGKQLAEEGRAMKHCVASYTWYCANGKTAIFSLRKYEAGFVQDIMATIEVNLALKRIVQAKAKMNKPISDEAKKYMTDWAEKEGLMINAYL